MISLRTNSIDHRTLLFACRIRRILLIIRLSICLTAFALPIILTWLGYLPFTLRALGTIKPWLYPSIIGRYHDPSLSYLLGNAPTVGQTSYIAVVVILNLVLLVVSYKSLWPSQANRWYVNHIKSSWLTGCGALAFWHFVICLSSFFCRAGTTFYYG